MRKIVPLSSIKFTIAGLILSIIGQLNIGRSSLIAIALTVLGVIFAGYGVFLAFSSNSSEE